MKKAKILVSILLFTGIIFSSVAADDSATVAPTLKFTSFFGSATIDGQNVKSGDIVTAFDPDGILCGQFTVTKSGFYGFMHIYGDEVKTEKIDEGALPGDYLNFFINGRQASKRGKWTRNGDRIKLDLVVSGSDSTPPSLLKVNLLGSDRLELCFSEALEEESTRDISNYLLQYEDSGTTLELQGLEFKTGETRVILNTLTLEPNCNFEIRVKDIRDIHGNRIYDEVMIPFTTSSPE